MGIDENIHSMMLKIHWKETDESIIELGRQTLKDKLKQVWSDAPAFYADFGFSKYDCIDLRCGTIIADLNCPLQGEQFRQYDFVTNFGTSEHIFDQQVVFSTIHSLCKVGGIMAHALPGTGWGDHGFYGYTESFIDALGSVNDYEELYRKTIERNGATLYLVAFHKQHRWFKCPLDPLYFKEE